MNEYMSHHPEYTKANRFKDIICKIYIYLLKRKPIKLPFLFSIKDEIPFETKKDLVLF